MNLNLSDVPEPVHVVLRDWVWWTLMNGFSVPLALPAVLLFLVLVLFFRLGAGLGIPRLFWHPERLPQFMVGIGIGAVLWQVFLAGYVFEEFATNFTVDRPPFCEVREPYTPGKGLQTGEYPGRFRMPPADVRSISAYAGVVTAALLALAITATILVLVIQLVGRFARLLTSGWKPYQRKSTQPRIEYAIWLPLGAIIGWGLMTMLTASIFSLPPEKAADPIGKGLIDLAGWGKAAERRGKIEQHVAESGGKRIAELAAADAPVERRAEVVQWFAPYTPVYAAFVINFAVIAVGSLIIILLPSWLRLFSPAVGIVLIMNILIFAAIILNVFPPLAVSGNFIMLALFGLIVVAGRAYKFSFPNIPSQRTPVPLNERYQELIAIEAQVTDPTSTEQAKAAYTVAGDGPTIQPVLSDVIRYPHPAAWNRAKPPLAIVSLSGGGSRSAAWAMQVLTALEDRFQKPGSRRSPIGLPYHTRLIVGASGGMIAGAYYAASLAAPGGTGVNRNPILRADGGTSPITHADLLEGVRRDLLTPITHSLVNHDLPALFAPMRFGHDRGRALENALDAACRGQLHVPMASLRDGEADGWRPSLIFSPMLVEDGRQLFISNLDLRAVTQNRVFILGEDEKNESTDPEGFRLLSREGVEFFKLFPAATDFTVATAARMSASFPYVLPAVMLPTNPPRRVVDAGYYDNFGIGIAASWIFNHMDWIEKNTSGVVVIQVRDGSSEAERKREVVTDPFPSLVERGLHWLTTPPTGLWNSRMAANAFQNDSLLHLLEDFFIARGLPRGYFATVAFELSGADSVALNFSLTDDEVQAIQAAAESEQFNKRADSLLNWWHARLASPMAAMSLPDLDQA